jgi:FkbM family methyltransferase
VSVAPTDPRQPLGRSWRRARSAAEHQYRTLQSRRAVRSLAGARLLREFERAYPDAFFIQIGSNDGEQHDPLRAAILRRSWRGIMIEPVPYVFRRLEANYGRFADRIALENVAIGDHDGPVPFFHLAPVDDHEAAGLPQWYDGIGSFSREHVLKHVEHIPDVADRLVSTEVPALTFTSLAAKHGVERVDLIHVDAEGSDVEVVMSIDLQRFRPRLLIYESYHLGAGEQARCRSHLEAQGYDTLEHGMDTWCLSLDEPAPRERRLVELWHWTKRENQDAAGPSLRRLLAGRPALRRLGRKAWHALKRRAEGTQRAEVEYWVDFMLEQTSPAEWRMLTDPYDTTAPLPPGAETDLAADSPRLADLRRRYAASGLPITVPSVWNDDLLASQLDLVHFRGESPFVWHYREWPRAMALKYFVFAQYVHSHDDRGLLDRLGEDGAFGCWTFSYPGFPTVSRDLLDSANELLFLDRHLGILDEPGLRVLDIGAGYGRTAYRMSQAASVADYCCVDAVPESTFVCEYYLRHRGCAPPARVVALDELDRALEPGGFDLALNIHSFSECTFEAVEWWFDRLATLRVPNLLVVPNDRDELLAFERDGSRRDFRPVVEAAGYELTACEPVVDDPAVQELLRLHDRFLLFQRRG